jgi:hypothetical protein
MVHVKMRLVAVVSLLAAVGLKLLSSRAGGRLARERVVGPEAPQCSKLTKRPSSRLKHGFGFAVELEMVQPYPHSGKFSTVGPRLPGLSQQLHTFVR